MPERNYRSLLEAQWARGRYVDIGLDIVHEKIHAKHASIPAEQRPRPRHIVTEVVDFNRHIVRVTREVACSYKLQLAHYLALGRYGFAALYETVSMIKYEAPEAPITLDGKFGDTERTNLRYIAFAFDELGADALTVQAFPGFEGGLAPFFDVRLKEKGVFVWCYSSNKGRTDFQERLAFITLDEASRWKYTSIHVPFYEIMACKVREWNVHGNCGVVVGATAPKAILETVRGIVGTALPMLGPGNGTQGGNLDTFLAYGGSGKGGINVIPSWSSSIIYAEDPERTARDANTKVREYIFS